MKENAQEILDKLVELIAKKGNRVDSREVLELSQKLDKLVVDKMIEINDINEPD
ncbi:Spo0E family sporulation regulatory protein-aspartic acid phosphatase [Metallumcola ferriviriculae]|uniref:Spo0E family sporulation regulatory protein-aspartic acid phosphatase n=1 Tax=Metallumcola ferriviriculae TaxID=3039180 RepID=A0AAU0UR67_9FIRM|nr:Spo0E family sporulation regulatory protein-aspartic acid phosphatase [Desulfitibacteraceae bacterium MK1]